MKNNKTKNKVPLIIVILLAVISIAFLLNNANNDGDKDLVEIRNYEGTKLDSINAFRENSIKGPQQVNVSDYRLKITGLVENPLNYTYEEVIEGFNPHEKVVKLDCVEGWSAKILWEGVKIKDLVKDSEPSEDAKIIIFHAVDGYTTSLSIDFIMENDLILAHKINGVILPSRNGFPFQLVAESKWGYKWCRWVEEIEFSDDEEYMGYWEQRGYSNSADLDESFWN